MKEGEQKAKMEDARKMLKEGLAVELIGKLTNLSRDEVEKMKK